MVEDGSLALGNAARRACNPIRTASPSTQAYRRAPRRGRSAAPGSTATTSASGPEAIGLEPAVPGADRFTYRRAKVRRRRVNMLTLFQCYQSLE